MNIKKRSVACLTITVGLLALTGCSGSQSFQLANEMTFLLDDIAEITISYDEEQVTFYENDRDDLIIKEYMTENKSSYYAKVDESNDSITVSEGGKPFFKDNFSRYIEVYLPVSYQNNLTVTTTDGDIDIAEVELSLNALRIDSTSGTVQLNAVEADNIYLSSTNGVLDVDCLDAETIKIDTTSGDFSCENLNGNVNYTTTSGDADIIAASGSGSYKANNSGELNVSYTEVTDDLLFFNKNDDINIILPADLQFEFEATTKNGSISTPFGQSISTEDRTTKWIVGKYPTVTVKAETNNGNIEVKQ
ncbi:MAG: DUF4097 domain-containing protein [Clostridia bacterium]|nr:DUF4097 domain-containing protein [Clostridia bacterium]